MRTTQRCCSGKSAFIRAEFSGTDFTEKLSFGAVILVKIRLWSIATRTLAFIVDVTFRATGNRFDFLPITPFDVRYVVSVIPGIVMKNLRKFINLKFLILWRVGIIVNPLLEWNISADKVKKIANYLLLILNVTK